jgi:hypothetical protein
MANQKQQRQGQGNPGRQNQGGGERREAPGEQQPSRPERESDQPIKRGQGREADPESELEEGDRIERERDDEGDVD